MGKLKFPLKFFSFSNFVTKTLNRDAYFIAHGSTAKVSQKYKEL